VFIFRKRLLRSVALGLLLQLNLLTLSAFHHHNDVGQPKKDVVTGAGNSGRLADSMGSGLTACLACQIMRLGARHPDATFLNPRAAEYSFFSLTRLPDFFSSDRPAAIDSRAPPLR
jgi:hypothetical protein